MALSLEQHLIADLMQYPVMTEEDGAQSADLSCCDSPQRLDGDGWPEIKWGSHWYPVPSMEDVEEWVFDSVCETPRGSRVETDYEGSWLSILGLI